MRRRDPLVASEDEGDVSPVGFGGARDPRRRFLMFSISTLRYGSGSFGFIWSNSSFIGEEGFEGVVNVTCGALFIGVEGDDSASVISTSGTSGPPSVVILFFAVSSTWVFISGGHFFHSSFKASPPIMIHSTVVIDLTVAVRRCESPRLATSPKYWPCFSRGLIIEDDRVILFCGSGLAVSCITSASPRTIK